MKKLVLLLAFVCIAATCEDPQTDACLSVDTYEALKTADVREGEPDVKAVWSVSVPNSVDVYAGSFSELAHFDRYTLIPSADTLRVVYSNLESTYPSAHYESASALTSAQATTLRKALCALGASSCC